MNNYREFAYDISVSQIILDADLAGCVGFLTDALLRDYAKTKFIYFPSWNRLRDGGLFKIEVEPASFDGQVNIFLYAQVPVKFIIEDGDLV